MISTPAQREHSPDRRPRRAVAGGPRGARAQRGSCVDGTRAGRRPRRRWRRRWRRRPQERDQRRRRRSVSLQLEHAVHALAARRRTSCGTAATACSSRTIAATTWVASADLTKQVDRCNVDRDGRRRRQGAAVEERRPRRVQHDHRRVRVAGDAGRGVGGHGRRQPAGQPRRRRDVHRSRQEHHGPAGGRAHERRSVLDLAHRGVALRRRRRRTSRSTATAATICTRTCS